MAWSRVSNGQQIERPSLERLRNLWRRWNTPHGAVWLPVLPPAGAFAELAVLLGIIHLINFIAPDIDVLNLEPSPYWLPILLLSLQYGTVAGLLAAGAATLAYVMNGLPEQNIDEHHFAYLLRVWSLPILWIGVSLVLGQFRMRQIELKQQLQAGLNQRTREAKALTGYVGELEQRCRELERLITAQGPPGGGRVLDVLAELGAPGTDAQGFLHKLCAAAFPRARLSVMVLQASAFEPAFSAGDAAAGEATKPPHRIATDHPLYKAIALERTAVCVLDARGEAALAGEGLAAAPVFHDEGGRVIGLIKLDRAGGEVLTPEIASRLTVAANMLAPLLSEPRIIIDNTPERVAAADAPRAARSRSHLSWAQARAEPGESAAKASCKDNRPRVQK